MRGAEAHPTSGKPAERSIGGGQPSSLGWIYEFFVEKASLFGVVLRELRGRGIEEAREIARLLERHGVPRGSSVLELGCGSGRIGVPLAREGYRVTCLDISPTYINEAVDYARSLGVEGYFEGIVGDAWNVDEIVSMSYDAVLLGWTTLLGYRGGPDGDIELLLNYYLRPDGSPSPPGSYSYYVKHIETLS